MVGIEVKLSKKDVNIAKRITKQGKESARKINRAHILLLANRKKGTKACSSPPEGRAKWSLRLLVEKIKLEISHVTVHNTLKKTKLNL